MEIKKIIVVIGATGKQGGAVIKHLLKTDFAIKAVSRSLDGPGAQKLRKMGIEVVQGDLNKPETLGLILAEAYGVFSIQNNWTSSVETELLQGKAIADAAHAAGVQHFIYSSVGGAERNTNIPHFDSKFKIEKHINKLGLPYTIVRPTYFMANLLEKGQMGFINWGLLSWALKRKRKLQMVDVDDIGAFVAYCFVHSEPFLGKAIELAGDELTYEQIKTTFTKVTGKPPFHFTLPAWLFKPISPEIYSMVSWFKTSGYKADIPALRESFPRLKTFEQALHTYC
ncbi:NmrA/HSCARG family protein [Microbulbifer sp. 2304DJ12-6]|uniref:NmrA/HSCARG family protein n=1 Tax=Microbulbifer sp. 2304DJ12-6 TaxID=3233340 RepID=UPI0039AEA423